MKAVKSIQGEIIYHHSLPWIITHWILHIIINRDIIYYFKIDHLNLYSYVSSAPKLRSGQARAAWLCDNEWLRNRFLFQNLFFVLNTSLGKEEILASSEECIVAEWWMECCHLLVIEHRGNQFSEKWFCIFIGWRQHS